MASFRPKIELFYLYFWLISSRLVGRYRLVITRHTVVIQIAYPISNDKGCVNTYSADHSTGWILTYPGVGYRMKWIPTANAGPPLVLVSGGLFIYRYRRCPTGYRTECIISDNLGLPAGRSTLRVGHSLIMVQYTLCELSCGMYSAV